MKQELIEILRCPHTGQALSLVNAEYTDGLVESGQLITSDGKYIYPIKNYIPRFVSESNYADNFGMQWNKFRLTQLDSYSGHPISANRFWRATGWNPNQISGKWLLDIGCGAGRFAEVALNAGAIVVAVDYSNAVDACYENLKHFANLHVIQGNVYSLPLQSEFFPFVYSLGVLQHTPDVEKAFLALPNMVTRGGSLCADFYWKRLRTMIHMKYILRPFIKHVQQQSLFEALEKMIPILLPISQLLGCIPLIGKVLKRIIPIADYTGIYPLTEEQLKEWALLDTFDMLSPQYDNPQTKQTIENWFTRAAFDDIEVLHEGHLVGRGRKN